MKPFSLEEHLKNPSLKIVTRDGREVEIIGTAASGEYPVTALVKSTIYGDEITYRYTKGGKYYEGITSELDLFFVSENCDDIDDDIDIIHELIYD